MTARVLETADAPYGPLSLSSIFSLLIACSLATACGSSNGATSSNDAGTASDGSAESSALEPSDGGGKSGFPGNPPSGSPASIVVTINGQVRTFDGKAGWYKSFLDGGTLVGFQTNAKDGKDWTLSLAVFGSARAPGEYTCGGTPHAGLGPTNQLKSDGGIDSHGIDYGSTVQTGDCSLTLVSFGPNKGDHVTGTFRGVLRLSGGYDLTTVDTMTFTDGKFDLVQFADTPP